MLHEPANILCVLLGERPTSIVHLLIKVFLFSYVDFSNASGVNS